MNLTRLALWWVDRYTRGGSEPARVARREEIASDVWEHRAVAGAGPRVEFAVLSRCVRGIPADISWRRSRHRGRRLPSLRTAVRVAGWSLAFLAYLFLVGAHGYSATAVVGFDFYGADWEPGDVIWYARVSAMLLALLLAGGILIRRWPRIAVAMLVAATLGTCGAFWWATPIYAPLGLAVVAAAVALARRRAQIVSSAAS
ncbi:MAG TPA: hypothetical protein VF073_02105 [Gaiella sp.]